MRRLKRRDGNEMISYRLTAQTGDVRGAVSFPIAELRPTLQPLYTVPIPHGDAGSDGSFRHQLALITEFQGDAGRLLSEGEYNDTLTGLVVSIHEGTDCGLLLWGPPADSLGAAANFTSALRVPGSCNFSTVVNINFGTVTDLLTLPQANGSVRIICTPSAGAITLTANGGTHVNFFFHRNMQILAPPPGVNNFISYDLFKPDGTLFYTTDSISLAGSATVVIAGKVLGNGGAFPRAGDYTDSVILTLTY